MKIKSYIDFIIESILYASNDFKKVLSNTDDSTAKELLSLIDKDINTNYNILRTTDRNDSILFISDTQSTNRLKSTDPSTLLLGSSGNNTSINRVVRSILNDNGINKTDREMEIFVNKFKAAYDKLNAKSDLIRVVDGEDIRFWYNSYRYCEETMSDKKGTLGKSCMRYEEAGEYLDIYCKNPQVCKLVIQLNEDNKLRSRALLWETSEGKYLDRIYYTLDSDQNLIYDWVISKYQEITSFDNTRSSNSFSVKLRDDVEYDLFPYMDSIPYYYQPTRTLYNYPFDKKKGLFILQETDGSAIRQDIVYSEYEDTEYPEDETVWSDYLNSHIHKSSAVWSERMNTYLHTSMSVYSSIIDDYLDRFRCHLVYKNKDKTEYDAYPENSEYYGRDYNMDELSDDFYINDLLIEHNGKYYLKDISILVYEVLPEDLEKYKSIYNTDNLLCTEIDKKIFNFKTLDDYDVSSKRDFYLKNYYKIVLDDFIEMLNSLKVNKDLIRQKIDEVMEANTYLSIRNSNIKYVRFYKANNKIKSEFGSIDNMMDWYTKFISNDLDNYYEQIKREHRYISWGTINDDVVKKLCLNPIHNNKYLPLDYISTLTDRTSSTKDVASYLIRFILNKLDDSKSNIVLDYFLGL